LFIFIYRYGNLQHTIFFFLKKHTQSRVLDVVTTEGKHTRSVSFCENLQCPKKANVADKTKSSKP